MLLPLAASCKSMQKCLYKKAPVTRRREARLTASNESKQASKQTVMFCFVFCLFPPVIGKTNTSALWLNHWRTLILLRRWWTFWSCEIFRKRNFRNLNLYWFELRKASDYMGNYCQTRGGRDDKEDSCGIKKPTWNSSRSRASRLQVPFIRD